MNKTKIYEKISQVRQEESQGRCWEITVTEVREPNWFERVLLRKRPTRIRTSYYNFTRTLVPSPNEWRTSGGSLVPRATGLELCLAVKKYVEAK